MKKLCMLAIILVAFFVAGCASGDDAVYVDTYENKPMPTAAPSPTPPQVIALPTSVSTPLPTPQPLTTETPLPTLEYSGVTEIFFGHMRIHWDDGYMQYGSRAEGLALVLYEITNDGADKKQLAVFYSRQTEWGRPMSWCRAPYVVRFALTDDWILLSIGTIEGSGRFFYGGLYSVKRDGSERVLLAWTDNESFLYSSGWVYHEHQWVQGSSRGWLRVRPDGTDLEYLHPSVYNINRFADEYIYGSIRAQQGFRHNLARWHVDGGEFVTLFYGYTLPRLQLSPPITHSHIAYTVTAIGDDYVLFTATVWGWREGAGRHGHFIYYTVDYRVNNDGSNLQLLDYLFIDRIYTMEIVYYVSSTYDDNTLVFVYGLDSQRGMRARIDARNARGYRVFVNSWSWEWTSDNTGVIEIRYTTLIPRGVGSATITATSPDRLITISREVTVANPLPQVY